MDAAIPEAFPTFSSPAGAILDYRVAYCDSFGCPLALICRERLVTLQEKWEGARLPFEESFCLPATGLKLAGALRRSGCFCWRTMFYSGVVFVGRGALGVRMSGCSSEARRFCVGVVGA